MTESAFPTHGRIICGTVSTPDLAGSLADYRGALGLRVVEEGRMGSALAASWDAPAMEGRGYALLQGGELPAFVRLVEGSAVEGHAPMTTPGWVAFELNVEDVLTLRERVRGSGFSVIGEPRRVEGFDTFIPFQVAGRAGEVLYLNQVLNPVADEVELPRAAALVDHIFIAVLGTRDAPQALGFLTEMLGLEEGRTYTIPVGVVNRAFGLDAGHRTPITMTRVGKLPVIEVDALPASARERPRAVGELPPGNAMLTMLVRDLDAVGAAFARPPAVQEGSLYAGRRSATVVGRAGQIFELVEMGA